MRCTPNMKHPLENKPTTVLRGGDNPIYVIDLPEDIRNEILTYDRYNQEKLDALYALEKAELLLDAKYKQVMELLKAWQLRKEDSTRPEPQ